MFNVIAIVKTPFAKEVAKTFVLTASATAGTFAGFLAIGMVWDGIDKIRDRRSTEETPNV